MLNLVPFTAARRVVQNPYGFIYFIGEILKLPFPQAVTITVRASAVGSDDYFTCSGIFDKSFAIPPSSDGFYCKNGCVFAYTDIYKAVVLEYIVNSVGCCAP